MDDIDYLDETSISGVNLYAYCNNNPVMYADPSGHFVLSIFLGVVAISTIVGAIDGGITAEMSGQNFWKGFAAGAISGAISGTISYLFPNFGNLLGRPLGTIVYGIVNEAFQTGTINVNNLGMYIGDAIMDMAYSLLYLDKLQTISNVLKSNFIGVLIDTSIDIVETRLFFSPQGIRDLHGEENFHKFEQSIF